MPLETNKYRRASGPAERFSRKYANIIFLQIICKHIPFLFYQQNSHILLQHFPFFLSLLCLLSLFCWVCVRSRIQGLFILSLFRAPDATCYGEHKRPYTPFSIKRKKLIIRRETYKTIVQTLEISLARAHVRVSTYVCMCLRQLLIFSARMPLDSWHTLFYHL